MLKKLKKLAKAIELLVQIKYNSSILIWVGLRKPDNLPFEGDIYVR